VPQVPHIDEVGSASNIELYHAMDMTFWLRQAEAALARVEGRS
jgi:hypothetical protein